MKETEYTNICRACRFADRDHEGNVERCGKPSLNPWRVMPKTLENTKLIAAAEAVARSKGLTDYDPLQYIAVSCAVVNNECKYFIPAD